MSATRALRARAPAIGWNVRLTLPQLTLALAALALGVRCAGLGMRPLWLDEAFSAWFSAQSWHYLWTVLPTYEAHPPFYYSLLKLWQGLFGASPAALRSLSVLFGVLTVPVIVAASLELERHSPSGRPLLRAGLAGFLAACAPMLVTLGQDARPYPLLAFAYALAVLGTLRLIRQFGEGKPGDWPSWLLLGGGSIMTLWAHSLGLLYVACVALALAPSWLKGLSAGRLLRGAATAAAVVLLYLPCLLMIAGRAQDWGTNWLRWEPDMLLQLLVLYSVPVEMLTVGSAVAALAMLLLVKRALGDAIAARGWNADRAVVLLWLGPPLLAAAISALFVPVFLARTLSGTLVPAYLALGGAVARTHSGRERNLLTAAICITLLPTALQTALRSPPERWDLLAAYLARNTSTHDQVWLYPSDSALPLRALHRPIAAPLRELPAPFPTLGVKGPIRAGWPAMVSLTPGQARATAADPALAKVPTIWLVTRQSGIFDPGDDLPKALASVRRPGPAQDWDYIRVQPYYLRAR